MRALLAACLLALVPASATAQILGIELVDEKAEKRYRKHLTDFDGTKLVVGELYRGATFDNGTVTYQPNTAVEFYVPNPTDPSFVPYEFKKGEKVPAKGKSTISVSPQDIRQFRVVMANQSLFGLTSEYLRRRDEIERLKEGRDDAPKGSAEWQRQHAQMMADYAELRTWLSRTCYASAVEKLDKEFAKEAKKDKERATVARLNRALESVRSVATPEALVAASQKITDGAVRFGVWESEHVRIYFDQRGLDESIVKDLLTFAEQAIEGFRRDFVDPWVSDDYTDHIPDHLFLELWFGPDERNWHQAFYEEFFGLKWGDNLEQKLAVRGITKRRTEAPEFLDYGKREDHDPFGVVAHRVGHVLADLHYNQGVPGMKQDWLGEAVGYHLAFEYFGRNDETCYSFKEPHRYAPQEVDDTDVGTIHIKLGERYAYNQLALDQGQRLDKLASLALYEMNDPDIAKSWSFYDYMVRREGLQGQLVLRKGCELARSGDKAWLNTWREEAAQILGVEPAKVYDELDARWRRFAENEQDTTANPRRKR